MKVEDLINHYIKTLSYQGTLLFEISCGVATTEMLNKAQFGTDKDTPGVYERAKRLLDRTLHSGYFIYGNKG